VAKEWEIEGLTPDESFREAAGKILRTKSAEMWHYAPGTIVGKDIEELHSMRVSSRRLRAAVDMCVPCYPPKEYARFQAIVSGLTNELGAVRDADVMLDFLERERKRVSKAERAGLNDLIAQVRARREALRPHMVAYLKGLMDEEFQKRFERFVTSEE
jgi:CHAD domain-containing protein